MRTALILLGAVSLVCDPSTTPGVQLYFFYEKISGAYLFRASATTTEVKLAAAKGIHAYVATAVKDGAESVPSNTVSVTVRGKK